jgi:hypothetical protein
MSIYFYSSVIDPEKCLEVDIEKLKASGLELNKVFVTTQQYGVCSVAVEATSRKKGKHIAKELVRLRLLNKE